MDVRVVDRRCALINVFYDLLFKCLKKNKNFIFINFAIVFEYNLTIVSISFYCIFTTCYLPIKFIYIDLFMGVLDYLFNSSLQAQEKFAAPKC